MLVKILFLTNLTNRIADRNYCVYECGKLLLMTTLGDLKNVKTNNRNKVIK